MEEIKRWHKARGFRTIGYHYVIELDGILREGRPLGQKGAHVRGHNEDSVGVCYVGGVDVSGKPKNTLNKAQEETLVKLLKDLIDTYGVSVHGHNEYSAKACPSFNVNNWWRKYE